MAIETKSKIQYINEDFLRRTTKVPDLSCVRNLCLSSLVISPYQIKYLEHLQHLKNLLSLNLSGNVIEKLDGLACLTKLKYLDLSNNQIVKLDGLQNLSQLQHLDLSRNRIRDIPSWFQVKLVSLKVLLLVGNEIDTLHQITKLRQLVSLTSLGLGCNPALLPDQSRHFMEVNGQPLSGNIRSDEAYHRCCRAFIIFHLRTLTILDNKIVKATERQEADSWFREAEASRINRQLEDKEAEVVQLTDAISQLTTQSLDQAATTEMLAREKEEQNRRLAEMQKELAAKDELLQAKTRELLRACLKHSEIEQELAFYRIDSKLAGLGRPPDPGEIPLGSEEDLRNTEESPYLGKCRYIRMASSRIQSSQRQGPRGSLLCGRSPDAEEGLSEQGGRASDLDPRRAQSMDLSRSCARPTTLDLKPFHHSSYTETDEGTSSMEFPQTRSEALSIQNRKLSRRQLLAMTHASLPSPLKCPVTLPYYGQSPEINDISEFEDTDSGGGGIRFNGNCSNSVEHSRSQTHSPASGRHVNGQESGGRAPDSGIETTNMTVHTNGSSVNGDQAQMFEPAEPSLEDVQLDSFNSLQEVRPRTNSSRTSAGSQKPQSNAGHRRGSSASNSSQNLESRSSSRSVEKKQCAKLQDKATQSSNVELAVRDAAEGVYIQQETDWESKKPKSDLREENGTKYLHRKVQRLTSSFTSGCLPASELRQLQEELRRLKDLFHSVTSAHHRQCSLQEDESASDSAACLQSPEDISRPPSEAMESSMSELTHDSVSATEADGSEACRELHCRQPSPSKRRASCQTLDGGRKKRFQHRAALSAEASGSATERIDSCASAREQPALSHSRELGRRISQSDWITNDSTQYKKNPRQATRLKSSISAIDLRRNCSGVETRRKRRTRRKSMESIDQALKLDQRTAYESTSTRDLRSNPLDVRLLFTLQDELCDLHRQLQAAEGTNAHRLQEAILYISQLESELQQHKLRTTKSDRSKRDETVHRQWMKQLSASLDEMKRCQQDIAELQKKLLEKESLQSPKQEQKSPSIVGRDREELAEIRNALYQQEREMVKLSETVNRLLTVPLVNAKANEVEHLTTGVSTIQQGLNLDRGQAGATTHRVYGSSDVTEVARVMQTGNLCCNVAEHHNLEDYIQQLQANNEQMQQSILHKRNKLEDSKVKNQQLEALVKQREDEVNQITQELLHSKEELLQTNTQMKALLAEQRKAKEDEKAHSSLLMQEVDDLEQSATAKKLELENIRQQLSLTSQRLADLQSQVSEFEVQKREREDDLQEVLKTLEEKRGLLRQTENNLLDASRRVAEAQENLRAMENKRRDHEQTISKSESMLSERRLGMDKLNSKIAETKSQLESLSREVGAKSAELDLLNSRSTQDIENSAKKLEDVNRELDQRQNELKSVKELLEVLSMEEKERLARKTLETSEVKEVTVQLAQLKAEREAFKKDLLSLDMEKTAKMAKTNEIRDELERESQKLRRLRADIQTEETRMAAMKNEYNCLRSQLKDLESNTKFKQKIIDDMCSTSEARISALNTEIHRLMESAKNISEQRAAAQAELTALRKHVQASHEELIRIQDRTNSATADMGRSEASLTARQRLNDGLNRETDLQTHRLNDPQTFSFSANSERMENDAELDRVVTTIGKSKKKLCVLSEMETVDGNLLRMRLQELEEEVKQKDQEIIRLTEVLQSNDRRTNQNLVDELERVRGQLAAAHRLCQKIKRRTGRELAQLERVAEEQCARAGLLYEELTTLKKNHTFLQARVAAAEELTDREQRLQNALSAVRVELKNCGAKAAENALEHFSVVETMMSRRSRSPLSGIFNKDGTSPLPLPVLRSPVAHVASKKTPLRKETSIATKDQAITEQKVGIAPLPSTVGTTMMTTMTTSRLAPTTGKADGASSFSPSSGIGSSPRQTATRSSTSSERRFTDQQGLTKRPIDADWERWQIAYRDISSDMQQIRQQINSACSGRGAISSSSVDEIAVTPTGNVA